MADDVAPDQTIIERAKREHERLMREDPAYRARYEEVERIWNALGA